MIQPPASLISSVSARVRDSMQVEARGDFHRLNCRAMSTPLNIAFAASSAAVAQRFRPAVHKQGACKTFDACEYGQQELACLRSVARPVGPRRRGGLHLLGDRLVAGKELNSRQ